MAACLPFAVESEEVFRIEDDDPVTLVAAMGDEGNEAGLAIALGLRERVVEVKVFGALDFDMYARKADKVPPCLQ